MIKIKKFSNIFIILACFIIAVSIFLLGSFLYLDIFYTSKFFPKSKIAGVELGGKTKEEAQELLTSKIQEWNEQNLAIEGEGKNWEIPNKDLAVDFDIEKTIEDAFNKGRKEGVQNQLVNRLKFIFFGFENSLIYTGGKFEEIVLRISSEADIGALNVGLKIEDGKVAITEEKSGKRVNSLELKYLILNSVSYLSREGISLPLNIVYPNSDIDEINKTKEEIEGMLEARVTLKTQSKNWIISGENVKDWIEIKSRSKRKNEKAEKNYNLNSYLNEMLEVNNVIYFLNKDLEINLQKEKVSEYLSLNVAPTINKNPNNATLGIDGGKVVILKVSKDGEALDVDSSINKILDALKKKEESVILSTKVLKAKVREDNISELGIIDLLGRGQSDFSGSSSSRKHNIKIGSSKFHGVLVEPGETFSFNKYLGPVDETGGFLPELVIKPGKLVKEYGGGLCQVATTAFRSALYSGVPITERKNHAFAVSYYSWPFGGPGVDATIYPPHPDLRFKNDTGKYILIQTSISGNRLTFDFYGTKGSRRTEVENPQYVEQNPDGSSKTVFYRNIYKNDELTKREPFYSFYKPASEYPKQEN